MAKEKPERGAKSRAVRELLEQNPRMKAAAVVSTLSERGIEVPRNLVYLIKSQSRRRRGKARRAAFVAQSRNAGVANPLDLLLKLKQLADQAGGMRKLKQLVDVMAE